MPPKSKCLKSVTNSSHGSSADSTDASKKVSRLFLEAVNHCGENVTQKKIYDYFESKAIHLKHHLRHLPVMTRSGAMYSVEKSEKERLKAKREASKSVVNTTTTRIPLFPYISKTSAGNPKKLTYPKKKIYNGANVSIPDNGKGKKGRKRETNKSSSCKQKYAVHRKLVVHGNGNRARVPDVVSSKRNIDCENYEYSAEQSIKEEKRSVELNGKDIQLTTKPTDTAVLKLSKKNNDKYDNKQFIISNSQVRPKGGFKKRKMNSENNGEQFTLQNIVDEKNF